MIEGVKLYLFYSAANREAFMISKEETLRRAEASWTQLSQDLVGPEVAEAALAAAGP